MRLDRRHAVPVIHDLIEAHPREITLIPVGPLTNIATVFLQYRELAAKDARNHPDGRNGTRSQCPRGWRVAR
jgi:inosine-uridine nucleoside N-ribohydrolase